MAVSQAILDGNESVEGGTRKILMILGQCRACMSLYIEESGNLVIQN